MGKSTGRSVVPRGDDVLVLVDQDAANGSPGACGSGSSQCCHLQKVFMLSRAH